MQSMTTTLKLLIITDLDGTLLDRETYTFEPATPALNLIRMKGIPLVLSSSKTREEMEGYRKKLENEHPFISENGGAVFVPKNYFSFPIPYDRELGDYFVLELGVFYPVLVETLNVIKRETGIPMKGFSDLTGQELSSLSGLSVEEAEFAKRREYDEPFVVEGGEEEVGVVKKKIEDRGLHYAWGGKFHHLLGKNDKGKAAEIVKELYQKEFSSIVTIGLGDSLNDLPMLTAVDRMIFLRGKGDRPLPVDPNLEHITVFDGTGPRAWNEAVLEAIKAFES